MLPVPGVLLRASLCLLLLGQHRHRFLEVSVYLTENRRNITHILLSRSSKGQEGRIYPDPHRPRTTRWQIEHGFASWWHRGLMGSKGSSSQETRGKTTLATKAHERPVHRNSSYLPQQDTWEESTTTRSGNEEAEASKTDKVSAAVSQATDRLFGTKDPDEFIPTRRCQRLLYSDERILSEYFVVAGYANAQEERTTCR